jgi:hypothetical protein
MVGFMGKYFLNEHVQRRAVKPRRLTARVLPDWTASAKPKRRNPAPACPRKRRA